MKKLLFLISCVVSLNIFASSSSLSSVPAVKRFSDSPLTEPSSSFGTGYLQVDGGGMKKDCEVDNVEKFKTEFREKIIPELKSELGKKNKLKQNVARQTRRPLVQESRKNGQDFCFRLVSGIYFIGMAQLFESNGCFEGDCLATAGALYSFNSAYYSLRHYLTLIEKF